MPTANTVKCQEARAWGESLNPCVHVVECRPGLLRFRLEIEPEPQVRQTGRSGAYSPGAIKYNAWKRACADALKEALRLLDLREPVCPGLVRLTAKFYVSSSRRFKVVDLGNYTKALEDMINLCAKDSREKYPDATAPLSVWADDRYVVSYGDGHGKYEALNSGRCEVTIESVKAFPKGKAADRRRT